MVFTWVEVIFGYKIDFPTLVALLKVSDKNCVKFVNQWEKRGSDEEEIEDFLDKINEEKVNFTIWTPNCCSEKRNKVFVIGTSVSFIPRLNVHCSECPSEWELCDNCLGMTRDGICDVYAIVEDFVEIPLEKICRKCHFHNAEPTSCPKCCYHLLIEAGKTVGDTREPTIDGMHKNRQKQLAVLKGIEPCYYFALDDCLSCS